MGDQLDDAFNSLRFYLDKVRREESEHEVNRGRADNILSPSRPEYLGSVKGFGRYVS